MRLSAHISDDTDRMLRRYLGEQGGRKGSISAFIEQAIREHIFRQTISTIQKRNEQFDPADIEATINEALEVVRAEHRS
jgi:hypothetical protein